MMTAAQRGLAANPAPPAPLLDHGLLTPADLPFGDPWRGLAVLEHPDAAPAWFDRLACDPDPVIRAELSARFPLPRALPVDAPELVRSAMASRTDLPDDVHAKLAEDELPGVRWDLASNPAAVAFLPRLLVRDRSREIRHAAAHNPGVPLELLVELSLETKAGRPLVPRVATAAEAELRTLARHGTTVAARIAANPRCPADLARALLAGAPVRAPRVLASHPGLAAESIVAHSDDRVVTAAAANSALPVTVLSTLTGSTARPGNSHGIGAALKKLR